MAAPLIKEGRCGKDAVDITQIRNICRAPGFARKAGADHAMHLINKKLNAVSAAGPASVAGDYRAVDVGGLVGSEVNDGAVKLAVNTGAAHIYLP